ncbi:MAG TPA: HAD family hydrolase [Chthonomonadaceae bacterium]|nr:HAD family hydrolase [Chthonomonadaceae bacterium]
MTIDWVFFDIGDVLFDENVPHLYHFHLMLLALRRHGVDVSWDDYRMQIQQSVRVRPDSAIDDAARHFVPDDALWNQIHQEVQEEYKTARKPHPYGLLLDNITAVVQYLHTDFRLGIVANQHPPILQALDAYGISHYFDVKAINEVIGLSKPDPAIFRWALEQAGCPPERALMIGDRPDNDIAPARSLGMRTIRFQRGLLYTWYEPLQENEHADLIVRETLDLPRAVRRLAGGG